MTFDTKNKTAPAIIAALEKCGPMAPTKLAEITGMSLRSIERHTKRLVDAGAIHIGRWKRQRGISGTPSPIYRFGPGESAPRPTITADMKRRRKNEWQREHRGKRRPDGKTMRTLRSLRTRQADNPFRVLVAQMGAA